MTTRKPAPPKPFAQGTEVAEEKSQAEIEKLLQRYGATQFMRGWKENHAVLGFEIAGRRVRILLPFPTERELLLDPAGRRRNQTQQRAAMEAERRRRWRALLLVLKAKLEAVASGIALLEDEFLPYLLLPDGSTMGEWARPQIARLYQTGQMPELLPGLPPASEGER